ncbi:MAG: LicD family protein [bacterium]|nr:LicD family protein [Candidatus Limimorpha caballi]
MDIDNKYGTLAEQKNILPILKDFDDFCLANDIKYSIDCGTLLGVIRHQGFVPWDDDIDFSIARSHLNKLINAIDDSEKLTLVKDLWFYRVTYKQGMCPDNCYKTPEVTLFVFDNAYENKLLQKLKVIRLLAFQQLFKERPAKTVRPFTAWVRLFVGWFLGLPFSYEWKFRHFNKACTTGSGNSGLVSCYGYWPRDLKIIHKSDILDRLHRREFEGISVFVMDDYDEHLTALYGDYMTPPSEKNRKTTHRSDQDWSN